MQVEKKNEETPGLSVDHQEVGDGNSIFILISLLKLTSIFESFILLTYFLTCPEMFLAISVTSRNY